MQVTHSNRWISALAVFVMVIPFFIVLSDVCACHRNEDQTACRQPGCCGLPETHTAHTPCCCLECAGDADPAVLPFDALPVKTHGTGTEISVRSATAPRPVDPAPASGCANAPGDIRSTGPSAAVHIESTILRM